MLLVLLGLGLATEQGPPAAVVSVWQANEATVAGWAPAAAAACAGGPLPPIEGPWLLECRDEEGERLTGVRLFGGTPTPHTRHGETAEISQVAWPSALGVRGVDVAVEAPFDGGTARLWMAFEAEVELPEGLDAEVAPPGTVRIRSLTLRGLERQGIEEHIEATEEGLRFCVQRQAMSKPGFSGEVGLSVDVDQTTRLEVTTSSGYPLLDFCLKEALEAQPWEGRGGADLRLSFSSE